VLLLSGITAGGGAASRRCCPWRWDGWV